MEGVSKILSGFILAAGRGERLRPVTDELPKPLVPVNNHRLIHAALFWLRDAGVSEIFVNAWYMREKLEKFIKDLNDTFSIKVECVKEENLLGTGGGVLNVVDRVKGSALLLHNSDVICDVPPKDVLNLYFSRGHPVCMVCVPYLKGTTPLYVKDGRIYIGKEKPADSLEVTYAGISVFSVEFLRSLPRGSGELVEKVLEPAFERFGPIPALVHKGKWADGGTPEGLESFRRIFKSLYTRSSTG